ncbi:CsgG/HfaB family protein [Spongiivirga citrea]|uniref:Outer membrane beta-barrel protein n=1 Tax=Spongiivirga citrea TaxID=1481457 RepID=A0A6M0CXT8_9FLAO|nr:CsgG/HfaB family protein [Spongiivirga citrea]NER18500.1 outer membrane beta-barrel protein [Spongiivirga citrea]
MLQNKILILAFLASFLLSSCGAYFNQPLGVEQARLGEETSLNDQLKSLPLPKEPLVAGVYKFRDQTGQYKNVEQGTSWSTAVSQGTTSILLKALEDSRWFVPIERENVGNLLNERQIIRNTRQQYSGAKKNNQPALPPLLYAGILLEGGVISYDSNILTGGAGARYFGAGASARYRQDRITVYLRAISTSNGKILKTVYVSKTVLSQAVDASIFRFVKLQRLLEAETGFTRNEPVQLAVTEAIEKAVETLIIEGVKDNIWFVKDDNEKQALLDRYEADVTQAESTELYNRLLKKRRSSNSVGITAGGAFIDGDFAESRLTGSFGASYKHAFSPAFGVSGAINGFALKNEGVFSDSFVSFDFNGELTILPKDSFSPYLTAGVGSYFTTALDDANLKFQYGLGFEYMGFQNIGIKIFGENNISIADDLDRTVAGKRNDHFWRFGIGLNYYF